MATQPMAAPAAYPLRFDVQYPPQLNRWLIFVKWLLAIPHFLIIGALGNLQGVITIIAWFAILFTGQFPRGIFNYLVGVMRWGYRVGAYLAFLRDEYSPFSLA